MKKNKENIDFKVIKSKKNKEKKSFEDSPYIQDQDAFAQKKENNNKINPTIKICILSIFFFSFLLLSAGLYVPFYKDNNSNSITTLGMLKILHNYNNFVDLAFALVYGLFYAINIIAFVAVIIKLLSSSPRVFMVIKNIMLLDLVVLLLFSIGDIGIVMLYKVNNVVTFPYFVWVLLIYTVLYMCLMLTMNKADMLITEYNDSFIVVKEGVPHLKKKFKNVRLVPYLFLILFTATTLVTFYFKLFVINDSISESAFSLILHYQEHGNIEKLVAYIFLVLCAISILFFIFSTLLKIADYKEFYFLSRVAVLYNFFIIDLYAALGIFIKYNANLIASKIDNLSDSITSVKTYGYIGLLFSLLVMIVYIFANKISISYDDYKRQLFSNVRNKQKNGSDKSSISSESNAEIKNPDIISDPCPAFTEIDRKDSLYQSKLQELRQRVFKDLTLKNLVDYIVEYAANSEKHLSYTARDISTFIAGMGASKLAILQGMSGTGKTSLPKIFAEAVCGLCDIVEVESSWRDKNELLGYYNEFSKKYTPKKFTQYLYEATLNKSIITFIVLDEMNLSRIEYYFSDFLSLMEADEDKRQIKLLDIQLFRYDENNKKEEYSGLKDGHTIMIPKNVWFIGTANRDESTFEISDKVYDRAQTMNFDKRASKITTFIDPMPANFVSYESLRELFDEALRNEYDAENDELIIAVEKILLPFRISFGNRILKQIEDFVKIYLACSDTSTEAKKETAKKEAVENILYSKVVRKLELKQIDNKQQLYNSFNELGLHKCCDFIDTLVEE